MKIHQLFKEKVSEDVMLKLVRCFGLSDMNDNSLFCKHDLMKHNTVDKIVSMKDELELFYLPCKSKYYLSNVDHKKCITILRQHLRLFGLKLHTQQKYLQSKKLTFYNIAKQNKPHDHQHNNIRVSINEKTTVNFN